MSLRHIHDFELALLEPCLAMSERGVRIDETRRQAMLADLQGSLQPLTEQVQALVAPLLASSETLPRRSLFEQVWTCPCCRNGKAKRVACWSCAGWQKKPTAKQLKAAGGRLAESQPVTLHTGQQDRAVGDNARTPFLEDFLHLAKTEPTSPFADKEVMCNATGLSPGLSLADVIRPSLAACEVCAGEGQRRSLSFNPQSDDQVKVVLYDLLKLPKRTKDGMLTTDEDALKSLLPHDSTGIVQSLLAIAKQATIAAILERIAPGEDGRIRTFYNPAGTETGRFSSAESWLATSTNLQNMPKREVTEPQFDVRRCFVPDEGCAFVEADLSGAEAWVTAVCCGDTALLARLKGGEDIHRWTAAYVFDKAVADVTPTERYLGKVARHALNYGMQWATFQRRVNHDADKTGVALNATDSKRIYTAYLRLHPLLERWWKGVLGTLSTDRALATCLGRRRVFLGRLAGAGGGWLGDTHRETISYEPQSTIADLLNRGLLRWWKQHDGKIGKLVMQVHDSVVLCVPLARVSLATKLLRACLEEEIVVHGLRFTIPADVSVSEESWGTMRKVAGVEPRPTGRPGHAR